MPRSTKSKSLDWPERPAKKSDWGTERMPKLHAEVVFKARFSEKRLNALRLGLVPDDMDDRWFVYTKDDVVHFHRSWTGSLIFELHLNLETQQHRLLINQDPHQFSADIKEALREFRGLLRFVCTRVCTCPADAKSARLARFACIESKGF